MTKKVTGKTSEIKSEFYISKNIKFKNLNWILEHLECGNGGTCIGLRAGLKSFVGSFLENILKFLCHPFQIISIEKDDQSN